jgi:hypothetical protein
MWRLGVVELREAAASLFATARQHFNILASLPCAHGGVFFTGACMRDAVLRGYGASAYSSVPGEQPEGASLSFSFPQPGGVVPSVSSFLTRAAA